MSYTKEDIASFMNKIIAREKNIGIDDISQDSTFFELGLDSISSVYLLDLLERKFNISLNPLAFWDYPTINLLADHIKETNF